ncbi:hypothetical protein OG579_16840 [Williamsia herbipolensis]|uniref:Uncharacterized protein n=1 Tax=Williamsia herbipolensis TaxID=1603258 RepID=A0AAU4K046_9NOCA|nr:hypothetical protein [Williamsia herbipolensis]
MTDLVPTDQIEQIVGVARHPNRHYARAVSAEQTVYILHSRECLDSGIDLRRCMFSTALDRGIDITQWDGHEDAPVLVAVALPTGRLIPSTGAADPVDGGAR